jgi:hypothetical protein
MRRLVGLLAGPAFGWEYWGGDRGGKRFSTLAQITPADVANETRTHLASDKDAPGSAKRRGPVRARRPPIWPTARPAATSRAARPSP